MGPKIHLAAAGHTCVAKRPAPPTFEPLFARLFLAIGPFCLILGPLSLRRLPLRACPLGGENDRERARADRPFDAASGDRAGYTGVARGV
jgi:hypothetical protein